MTDSTGSERRNHLFGQIRELRKDNIELRKSLKCMHDSVIIFLPMLTEMLETQKRMRTLRWAVYTAAAIGGFGGMVWLFKFFWFLLFNWIRTPS